MSAANSFPFLQCYGAISPETIRDKKMMLSGGFMKKFKSELSGSDKLTLEVPDGIIWTVGWVADEKLPYGIWLVSGFDHFLRFYSVSPDQILFFSHIESTRLKVVICRSTSMEITYPAAETPEPEPEMGRNSDDDDDDDGFLELWKQLRKSKKMVLSNKFTCATFLAMSVDTKRAIQRALLEMKSATNISTMVVLKTSLISPTGNMRLPLRFTRKFCTGDSVNVRLQVCEGTGPVVGMRTWLVEFKKVAQTTQRHIKGWAEFRVDNGLVEGDVCVFELIPPSEEEVVAVKVGIFRAD